MPILRATSVHNQLVQATSLCYLDPMECITVADDYSHFILSFGTEWFAHNSITILLAEHPTDGAGSELHHSAKLEASIRNLARPRSFK